MSGSVYNYLVIGYILPNNFFGEIEKYSFEEYVDKLVEELNCDFVCFNTGYDTIPIYAIVPKCYKPKEELSEEQFLKVLKEAKDISRRSSKPLPKLVIKSVYYEG